MPLWFEQHPNSFWVESRSYGLPSSNVKRWFDRNYQHSKTAKQQALEHSHYENKIQRIKKGKANSFVCLQEECFRKLEKRWWQNARQSVFTWCLIFKVFQIHQGQRWTQQSHSGFEKTFQLSEGTIFITDLWLKVLSSHNLDGVFTCMRSMVNYWWKSDHIRYG